MEVLNIVVDVVAVVAGERLLALNAARASQARFLTRISGVTILSLGAYLALAKRQA